MPPCAAPLPWLDFVATGGQSHLFGTDRWVIKIPRRSWQYLLARVVAHPRDPLAALASLGGLVEPFALVENVAFAGPVVIGTQPEATKSRTYRARWAVVVPRHRAGDFLDRRIDQATPEEAAHLIEGMLEVLVAIKARGFHLLDFIMSNFVVIDGEVRLVDTGLLIPARHLRWPTQQVTSRLFARRMVPDYVQVLHSVLRRAAPDASGHAALRSLMVALPHRIADWRTGRLRDADRRGPSTRVSFPPELTDDITSVLRLRPIAHGRFVFDPRPCHQPTDRATPGWGKTAPSCASQAGRVTPPA